MKFFPGMRVAAYEERRVGPKKKKTLVGPSIGIVIGNYAMLCNDYDKENLEKYSLLMLRGNGEPYNVISWWEGKHMAVVNDDVMAGLKIIADYQTKLSARLAEMEIDDEEEDEENDGEEE